MNNNFNMNNFTIIKHLSNLKQKNGRERGRGEGKKETKKRKKRRKKTHRYLSSDDPAKTNIPC